MSLAGKVRTQGGITSIEVAWELEVWGQPLRRKFVDKWGDGEVQLDMCCLGRQFRRTTMVVTSDALALQGNIICPGRGHPEHRHHESLRGYIRVGNKCVLKSTLAGHFPVPAARGLACCFAAHLEPRGEFEDVEAALISFPPTPRSMVEESEWRIRKVGIWKREEEIIFLKDARASLDAFSYGVRMAPGPLGGYEQRHFCLGYNERVFLSYTKGRSSHFAMNQLQRIRAAISFVFRAVGRGRHLPGHRHPCDAPTRPPNSHPHSRVPGGILRLSSACPQSCCPLGLCRC